jgi:hypothetical protein
VNTVVLDHERMTVTEFLEQEVTVVIGAASLLVVLVFLVVVLTLWTIVWKGPSLLDSDYCDNDVGDTRSIRQNSDSSSNCSSVSRKLSIPFSASTRSVVM